MGNPMTEETEQWLVERLGRMIYYFTVDAATKDDTPVLAVDGATNYESKEVTII